MLFNTTRRRSGCLLRSFFGCSTLLFFFILIIVFLLNQLPEIRNTKTEKKEFNIEYDSLTRENIIKSSFTWGFVDNELQSRKYTLNFRLLEKDVKDAMLFIDNLASMKYTDLGLPNSFPNPETEARVVWAEVYRRIYDNSIPQMKSILQGLNKIFTDEKLNAKDKVIFVITFIQNINYGRPGGMLDLFPPLGTIAYRYGDCDSKTLLLYTILEKMGIDCAMLWSFNYKHAMLGLNVIGRGDYLTFNGKKYYFLETTYPNWGIGEIPPEFNNKRFWFIDELDSYTSKQKLSEENNEIDSRENVRPEPAKP